MHDDEHQEREPLYFICIFFVLDEDLLLLIISTKDEAFTTDGTLWSNWIFSTKDEALQLMDH